jgi:NADH:ubiquinone oxidoreductase subunit 3 (subunit A)
MCSNHIVPSFSVVFIINKRLSYLIYEIFYKSMYFNQEYYNILILFLFSTSLAFIILFASFFLSNSNPDPEKLSAYECGFDPYEDARNVFDIRFYLVAILFLVFDLEAIYFFPWAVCLSFLNSTGFFGMLDFIVELLVGFIYVWEIGVLNWN